MKIKDLRWIVANMYVEVEGKRSRLKNELETIFKKLINELPLDLNFDITHRTIDDLALRGVKNRDSGHNSLYYFELVHDKCASIEKLRGLEFLDKERYKAEIHTNTKYGEHEIYLKLTDKKYQVTFDIRLSPVIFNKFIL